MYIIIQSNKVNEAIKNIKAIISTSHSFIVFIVVEGSEFPK